MHIDCGTRKIISPNCIWGVISYPSLLGRQSYDKIRERGGDTPKSHWLGCHERPFEGLLTPKMEGAFTTNDTAMGGAQSISSRNCHFPRGRLIWFQVIIHIFPDLFYCYTFRNDFQLRCHFCGGSQRSADCERYISPISETTTFVNTLQRCLEAISTSFHHHRIL